MRHSKEIITSALDLYSKGLSLRQIRDHFKQFHGVKASQSTILAWIHKYAGMIKKYTDSLKIEHSPLLHADETVFRFNGHKNWFWACIDGRTRYLMPFELTRWRWGEEAVELFSRSKQALTHAPNAIMTDGFQGYERAIRGVFPQSLHIRSVGCADPMNHNVKIESFNRTVKDRVKAMHSFKSFRSARLLLECWRIWYNFMKPHEGLKGKTPAEAAGLFKPNSGNVWLELINRAIKT